jgi:hypothetical protein
MARRSVNPGSWARFALDHRTKQKRRFANPSRFLFSRHRLRRMSEKARQQSGDPDRSLEFALEKPSGCRIREVATSGRLTTPRFESESGTLAVRPIHIRPHGRKSRVRASHGFSLRFPIDSKKETLMIGANQRAERARLGESGNSRPRYP